MNGKIQKARAAADEVMRIERDRKELDAKAKRLTAELDQNYAATTKATEEWGVAVAAYRSAMNEWAAEEGLPPPLSEHSIEFMRRRGMP